MSTVLVAYCNTVIFIYILLPVRPSCKQNLCFSSTVQVRANDRMAAYPLKQAKINIGKHKVDDAVTVDKKRDNNNDIQRSEKEDKQQQSTAATTNTVL
jgi:hypothetical protein